MKRSIICMAVLIAIIGINGCASPIWVVKPKGSIDEYILITSQITGVNYKRYPIAFCKSVRSNVLITEEFSEKFKSDFEAAIAELDVSVEIDYEKDVKPIITQIGVKFDAKFYEEDLNVFKACQNQANETLRMIQSKQFTWRSGDDQP